jgi:LytS/YehU family sensor histidine kinase
MGHRLDAKYELIKENIDESLKVPPLLFHTLIENGLTHAFKPKENGTFRISLKKEKNFVEYRLINDGSLISELNEAESFEIEEGTGIKYVKTRLEECYPGKWKMEYGIKNSNWEVVIRIYGRQK